MTAGNTVSEIDPLAQRTERVIGALLAVAVGSLRRSRIERVERSHAFALSA